MLRRGRRGMTRKWGVSHRTEVSPTIRNKNLRNLLGHGGTCLESWSWENRDLTVILSYISS